MEDTLDARMAEGLESGALGLGVGMMQDGGKLIIDMESERLVRRLNRAVCSGCSLTRQDVLEG